MINNIQNIAVRTSVSTGQVRKYETYDDFISEWRFWQAGGKKSMREDEFETEISKLKEKDVNHSSATLMRAGLEITFILQKY